jgi:hypothetical protein
VFRCPLRGRDLRDTRSRQSLQRTRLYLYAAQQRAINAVRLSRCAWLHLDEGQCLARQESGYFSFVKICCLVLGLEQVSLDLYRPQG